MKPAIRRACSPKAWRSGWRCRGTTLRRTSAPTIASRVSSETGARSPGSSLPPPARERPGTRRPPSRRASGSRRGTTPFPRAPPPAGPSGGSRLLPYRGRSGRSRRGRGQAVVGKVLAGEPEVEVVLRRLEDHVEAPESPVEALPLSPRPETRPAFPGVGASRRRGGRARRRGRGTGARFSGSRTRPWSGRRSGRAPRPGGRSSVRTTSRACASMP